MKSEPRIIQHKPRMEKSEDKGEQGKGFLLIVAAVLIAIAILFSTSFIKMSWIANSDQYGNVEVALQDQYTETIDLFLVRFLNNVTLANNVSVGQFTFNVLAGHNIVVGNYLCFKENKSFLQARVTTVNVNTITIDMPFDYPFTTNAIVCNTNRNLNVAGSPANPVIFRVSPQYLNNVSWDINWMMFHIMDDFVMDDNTFGGIPQLTNGIVVRKMDGVTNNFFNVRYNGDFAHHMKQVEFIDRAPAGLYGFRAYKTFNGQPYDGVSVRLNSETADTIEVIVRDDLTALTTFHVTVHGHVVD